MVNFEKIEYFIVTDRAVVSVFKEEDGRVKGEVFCAKKDMVLGEKVNLKKEAVVNALHEDKLKVIEQIPNWWELD